MKSAGKTFKEVSCTSNVVDLEEVRLKYGERALAELVKTLEKITGEKWS